MIYLNYCLIFHRKFGMSIRGLCRVSHDSPRKAFSNYLPLFFQQQRHCHKILYPFHILLVLGIIYIKFNHGTCLCLFSLSCHLHVYCAYEILSVLVCIIKFILDFPPFCSVLKYHRYIHANISLWRVAIQVNIFPTTISILVVTIVFQVIIVLLEFHTEPFILTEKLFSFQWGYLAMLLLVCSIPMPNTRTELMMITKQTRMLHHHFNPWDYHPIGQFSGVILQPSTKCVAQLSGAVEYTYCYLCRRNAGILGNVEHPFIVITPRSTLAWSGSTW